MIRVSISSKNNQMIQQSFEQFFQKEHLEYRIVPYQKQSYQDIYIFEIKIKKTYNLLLIILILPILYIMLLDQRIMQLQVNVFV